MALRIVRLQEDALSGNIFSDIFNEILKYGAYNLLSKSDTTK